MEKQEMEVEWTLEKETGNRTGNEKCWHRICFLHGLMSSVFSYCALDYLAMVIWLALWVLCFAFTLYCALWWLIQCDWLALIWQAMLQSSLVHRSGYKISCNLTMRVIHWVLGQGQCSYSRRLTSRLSPLPVLITYSMESKWWLHI